MNRPPTLPHLLDSITDDLTARAAALDRREEELKNTRGGSRFAAPGSSEEVVKRLAAPSAGTRTAEPFAPGDGGSLAGAITKAMAQGTPAAGGYLVERQVADDVMRSLRAQSAVLSLPVRRLEVRDSLVVNAVSSGSMASYTAENAAIAPSEMVLSQTVLLEPRALAALVPASNKLLRNAARNPALDALLREDMAEVLSLRADLAFLRGTGTGEEPLGIVNTVGVDSGLSLGADGAYLSLPQVRAIASIPRKKNGRYGSPGWVFAPGFLTHLEGLTDADGHFLADSGILRYDDSGAGGTLFGWPFRTTSQLPENEVAGASDDTTTVLFSSDWSEVIVGENPELEVAVSAEASYTPDGGTTWVSAFQNDQTLYRAIGRHDIGLRRPQLMVVQRGVKV
jgi:HK97 family phage major capsid protein